MIVLSCPLKKTQKNPASCIKLKKKLHSQYFLGEGGNQTHVDVVVNKLWFQNFLTNVNIFIQ